MTTKLYLTAYSTTTGAIKPVVGYSTMTETLFRIGEGHAGYYHLGKQLFRTEDQAKKAVEAAITKRIASLEKQIIKLKNIQIYVEDAA